MPRRGARLAALALVLCAAAGDRLAGAQEAEPDDAARVRILAAALSATGRRAVLRGAAGACSPWGAREMALRGDPDGEAAGSGLPPPEEESLACAPGGTPPALRESGDDARAPADVCPPEGPRVAADAPGEHATPETPLRARGAEPSAGTADEEPEAPSLRPMPLRSEDDIPRGAVDIDDDVCEPRAGAPLPESDAAGERGGEPGIAFDRCGGAAEARAHVAGAGPVHLRGASAGDAAQGAPGGALDGLLEHLEDDTKVHAPTPSGRERCLSCLPGSAAACYSFGSPLAAALDAAGMAGLVAHYLIYHASFMLVPSGFRRSDRAVGTAVICRRSVATL